MAVAPTTSLGAPIDEGVRRQFEAAWREGRPESIEHLLPGPEQPHYLATLEELVHIELEFAWKLRPRGVAEAAPTMPQPSPVAAYLARFPCLNQPTIVQRLREQEERVRRRSEEVPAGTAVAAGLSGGAAGPSLPEIPGYEVLAVIAAGGMGVVLKARQLSLNRVVALKMILAGSHASAEERARFQTEAEAVARLQHPNIVQIYEVGEHAGQPYLALEFVDGGNLAQQLAGLPQPALPAAQLVATLARTMHAAHQKGIVHRDLKPANILLQRANHEAHEAHEAEEEEHTKRDLSALSSAPSCASCASWFATPKITDFGLAKRLEGEGPTKTGAIMGTPSYMAPEQAVGRIRDVGPRTDVYALGAILYEMLTGRPPFRGETPLDTIEQVRFQEPVSLTRLLPKLSRDLETICLKCLQKEPPKRYGSAQALADDLERFLQGEPIQARPVGPWGRLWRWARRRPAVASLSATLGLAIVAAIAGLFLWQRAELEFAYRQAQQIQQRLAGLHTAATTNQRLAQAELQPGRFASAEKFLQQAVEGLRGELALADFWATLEAQYDQVQRLVEFFQLADKAERLAFVEDDDSAILVCRAGLERLGVFNHPRDWWAHLPTVDLTPIQSEQLVRDSYRQLILLAGLHCKEGLLGPDREMAVKASRAALAILELVDVYQEGQGVPAALSADLLEAQCRLNLREFHRLRRPRNLEPATAVDCYFVGLAHAWMGGSPDDDPVVKALQVLGPLLGLDFAHAGTRAQQLLRKAAAVDPQHYWNHHWLGWYLMLDKDAKGAELAFTTGITLRPDDARGYAERAHALAVQHANTTDATLRKYLKERCLADAARADQLDALDRHDAWIHWPRYAAFVRLERPADALTAAASFLELGRPLPALTNRQLHGEHRMALDDIRQYVTRLLEAQPDDIHARSVLALVQLALGDDKAAFDAAERALTGVSASAKAFTMQARAVRAEVFVKRQEARRALAEFEEVLGGVPQSYRAAFGRARAYAALGEREKALTALEQVLALAVTDWQRVEAHQERARILFRLGRTAEARQTLDQVRALDPRSADALAAQLFSIPEPTR